jgi:hypothetical protein
MPLHTEGQAKLVTVHEVFRELESTIWSELDHDETANSFRRNLQRAHLGKLIDLVTKPAGAPYSTPESGNEPAGQLAPPEDARSSARANLVVLQTKLGSALATDTLDDATRAHYDESRARILAALEASLKKDL